MNICKKNKILHDPRFDETDEDFLVQALLQARMNRSNDEHRDQGRVFRQKGFGARAEDAESHRKLCNLWRRFLCYTVKTPITYGKEIEGFKAYFTPGFASDNSKHEQLRRGLRASYFDATLESLETTETLDTLFDIGRDEKRRWNSLACSSAFCGRTVSRSELAQVGELFHQLLHAVTGEEHGELGVFAVAFAHEHGAFAIF